MERRDAPSPRDHGHCRTLSRASLIMIEEFPCPKPFSSADRVRAIKRYWYLILICAVLELPAAACMPSNARPSTPPPPPLRHQREYLERRFSRRVLQAAQELAGTFARVVQSQMSPTRSQSRSIPLLHGPSPTSTAPRSRQPVRDDHRHRTEPHRGDPGGERGADGINAYARKLVGASSAGPRSWPRSAPTPSRCRAQTHRAAQGPGGSRDVVVGGGNRDPNNPRPTLQHQIEQATAAVAEAQTQLQGRRARTRRRHRISSARGRPSRPAER